MFVIIKLTENQVVYFRTFKYMVKQPESSYVIASCYFIFKVNGKSLLLIMIFQTRPVAYTS